MSASLTRITRQVSRTFELKTRVVVMSWESLLRPSFSFYLSFLQILGDNMAFLYCICNLPGLAAVTDLVNFAVQIVQ